MVAMTSNGTVKYEIRFVFSRCQGENHPFRAGAESCESVEFEFFIYELVKSSQSDALKKRNDEIFQKDESAILMAPVPFLSGIFRPFTSTGCATRTKPVPEARFPV